MANGEMKSNPMKIQKLPVKTMQGDAMHFAQLTVNYLSILILIQKVIEKTLRQKLSMLLWQKPKLVDFALLIVNLCDGISGDYIYWNVYTRNGPSEWHSQTDKKYNWPCVGTTEYLWFEGTKLKIGSIALEGVQECEINCLRIVIFCATTVKIWNSMGNCADNDTFQHLSGKYHRFLFSSSSHY